MNLIVNIMGALYWGVSAWIVRAVPVALFFGIYFYYETKDLTKPSIRVLAKITCQLFIFWFFYFAYLAINVNDFTRVLFNGRFETEFKAVIATVIYCWISFFVFKIAEIFAPKYSGTASRYAFVFTVAIALLFSSMADSGGLGAAVGSTFSWTDQKADMISNALWRFNDYLRIIGFFAYSSIAIQFAFNFVSIIFERRNRNFETSKEIRKPWSLILAFALPIWVYCGFMNFIFALICSDTFGSAPTSSSFFLRLAQIATPLFVGLSGLPFLLRYCKDRPEAARGPAIGYVLMCLLIFFGLYNFSVTEYSGGQKTVYNLYGQVVQ